MPHREKKLFPFLWPTSGGVRRGSGRRPQTPRRMWVGVGARDRTTKPSRGWLRVRGRNPRFCCWMPMSRGIKLRRGPWRDQGPTSWVVAHAAAAPRQRRGSAVCLRLGNRRRTHAPASIPTRAAARVGGECSGCGVQGGGEMQGGLSRGQRESAAPRDVPLFPLFPRRACPRVSAGDRSRLSRSARGARQHGASSWMADAVDVCAGGLAVTGWTRPPPRAGCELWECRWANERWSPQRRANERASGAAIRTRRSNAAREPERYSVGHVRRAQGRGG